MQRIAMLCALIVTGYAGTTSAAELSLHITGARSGDGQLLLSVFDTPASWMKQPLASAAVALASDGSAHAVFDLTPGTYAIALVHDANGNGELDTNFLGIPTEAFGFSNQARARFGPPAFRKAAFDLEATGIRLSLSLDRVK